MHGRGRLTWATGGYYQGVFKDGDFHQEDPAGTDTGEDFTPDFGGTKALKVNKPVPMTEAVVRKDKRDASALNPAKDKKTAAAQPKADVREHSPIPDVRARDGGHWAVFRTDTVDGVNAAFPPPSKGTVRKPDPNPDPINPNPDPDPNPVAIIDGSYFSECLQFAFVA